MRAYLSLHLGYHHVILLQACYSGLASSTEPVLSLSSNNTGIKLDLYTNQQALIVYTCNKLDKAIPLEQNQQHDCVAIETQG